MLRTLKRLFGSVFTRLLATTVIAGFTITIIVVIGFVVIRVHSENSFQRNLQLYAEYLADDVGDPPDPNRAKEIARRTGLVIHFAHPEISWQTAPLPRLLNIERAWIHKLSSGMQMGSSKGQHFIRIAHGGGVLTFVPTRNVHHGEEAIWVLGFTALAMATIFGAAYFYIRKTLNPLHSLKMGVDAVGNGDLHHRIPEAGCTELTELASAYNQMAFQVEQLLASKEQLLLDISHELRSPITRLKVQLTFLTDEEARESLGCDVAEMENMVTSLLESARLRNAAAKLKLQPVDVAEIIQSLKKEFKESRPGVIFGKLVNTKIKADAEKIRMVLRNLLDNAIKHTPEDGDKILVSMEEKKECLRIVVQDQGEGIHEKDLPFLFEPFYRPDRSRSRKTGGYGLGLSLCKAIVDAHGGRIALASTVGKGTRVTVCLSTQKREDSS
jgi:signal transduction histidine kinase